MCEDDPERGRDKHAYTKLAGMFKENGCSWIDDITLMTPMLIKMLATQAGVDVNLGLVLRVYDYAATDVIRIRRALKDGS